MLDTSEENFERIDGEDSSDGAEQNNQDIFENTTRKNLPAVSFCALISKRKQETNL